MCFDFYSVEIFFAEQIVSFEEISYYSLDGGLNPIFVCRSTPVLKIL